MKDCSKYSFFSGGLKGAETAFGENAERVESIYNIMQGLEKSPFFSDVRSSFSKENNNYSKPGANFEIRCKMLDARY